MSSTSRPPIDTETLQQFHPLCLVQESTLQGMLDDADFVHLKHKQFLFKKAPPPETSFFLLEGEVELRESFNVRHKVEAGGKQAGFALEELCKEGASIRALSDALVLTLPKDAVDAALASMDEEAGYEVELMDDAGERLAEARFDDEYSEDWMVKILESPLMSYLSAADTQRCFMELERIDVIDGEVIVRAGTRGESFYILIDGEAEVLTEADGPFGGQRFELGPGDYFGEEALIADTIRNATIRMVSDGRLGRLSSEQFDTIFRKSLVQTIDPDKARGFLESAGIPFEVLDVRFTAEYRHGHRENAQNLPIVMLRKNMRQLDRERSYLVTPEGGRRSELAVFLLRQAGLNAYLLSA